jgi:tRNA nucleotidyltransferase (CCA-adding enzyme)
MKGWCVVNINFNLPTEVEEILHLLNKNGYEAYIVGGCVRDKILGRTPHDYDICTSAKPHEVIEVFRYFRVIETGLQHGTVTVMINNQSYEITTFRIDGEYSDNRRPDKVEFTTNIKDDLSRRDFTINAMAYSHKDGLIDPFHGLYDIREKVIRCVGNPNQRFNEDALRILRAMRFAVQLDFKIALSTFESMQGLKDNIKHVSSERISAELMKMLESGKKLLESFTVCRDIISVFIPEFIPCFNFKQNNPYHLYDVYSHILHAVDNYAGNDMKIKLALLLHDIGKPSCYSEDENGGHFIGHGIVSSDMTNTILKRLRFDNETIKDVTELVLYHDSTIEHTPKTIKRWLNKIGEEQFRRLLEIRLADILAHSSINRKERFKKQIELAEMLNKIVLENECFTIKDLQVNGNDLMYVGYKQGRQIGAALQGLLDCVIANEIENDKEKLLELAKGWNK